ncbi:hypothetical protein OAL98_03835 [Gammaproteobacteria bacterium]|nr:hypothetical protein [Gammaproteobacteria bacterium]
MAILVTGSSGSSGYVGEKLFKDTSYSSVSRNIDTMTYKNYTKKNLNTILSSLD